jgi:DNA-binding beta-propeller fold protein YncE
MARLDRHGLRTFAVDVDRGRDAYGAALAGVVVVLLLASSGIAIGSATAGSPPRASALRPAPLGPENAPDFGSRVPSAISSRPGSDPGSSVVRDSAGPVNAGANDTLVPVNGTLFPGNDHPVDGGSPVSVAFDPATGLLYTADGEFDSVSVVDPVNDRVLSTIPLAPCGGCLAEDVLVDPGNGDLYVTTWESGIGAVDAVDPTDGALLGVSSVPSAGGIPYAQNLPEPSGVYDPANGLLYFTAGEDVDAFSPSITNVTAMIPVVPPNAPTGECLAIGYDGATGEVFVTATNSTSPTYPYSGATINGTYNVVAEVDPAGGSVVATIPVGYYPDAVGYDPVTDEVFVSNGGSGNVTALATVAIPGVTYAPAVAIPVGGIPVGLAFDPTSGQMEVANLEADSVQSINGSNHAVVGGIDRIAYPMELAFDPSGNRLFVVDQRFLTEGNLSADTLTGRLALGEYPNGLALSPGADRLFGTSGGSGSLGYSDEAFAVNATRLIVTAATNLSTPYNAVPPPPAPQPYFSYTVQPIVDPAAGNLWAVTTAGVVEVLGIPQLHYLRSISVGAVGPGVYDAQDGQVYFAGPGATVTVVNATSYAVGAPIAVGPTNDSAVAIAVDTAAREVDVVVDTPLGTSNVTIVNTTSGSIASTVVTGDLFNGIAVDPVGDVVLLTDAGLNVVDAFRFFGHAAGAFASLKVGPIPVALVVDSTSGLAYVADTASDNVSVVNVSYTGVSAVLTLARTLTIGSSPDAFALDLPEGYLFVATSAPSSSVAAVSIGANPLAVASFSATPDPATLGQTMTVRTIAVGGTAPLSYSYSGLPPGCSGSDQPTLRCVPSTAGNFTLGVLVSGASGSTASASLPLTVALPAPPVIATFSATPDPAFVGQSVLLSTTVTGGGGTLSYAYAGLPPTNLSCPDLDSPLLSCFPSASGNYSLTVTVRDSYGRIATAALTLVVDCLGTPPGPEVCGFFASPDPVGVGDPTTLNVSTLGGTAPLRYSYTGLPVSSGGCSSEDLRQLPCVPSAAGSYQVEVTVIDALGATVTAGTPLLVGCQGTAPGPSICAFSASPDPIEVGRVATLSATAAGGNGSLSYAYSGLPVGWTGCPGEDTSSIPCLPATTGTQHVVVRTTDSRGGTASAALSLVVVCAGSLPGPTICGASALPAVVEPGETSLLGVNESGGTGPFTYAYAALPPGCTGGNTPTLNCRASAPGDYLVRVTVTDPSGRMAEANLSLMVLSPGSALPASLPAWVYPAAIGSAAAIGLVIGLLLATLERRRRAPSPAPAPAPVSGAPAAPVPAPPWDETQAGPGPPAPGERGGSS